MKFYFWLPAILLVAAASCKKIDDNKHETADDSFLVTPTGTLGNPNSIASNSNNIYITGSTFGTAGTPVQFGDISLSLVAGSDAFITKYDRKGRTVWAKILGGNDEELGYATAVDKSGNVYVAGSFKNTAVIDGVTLTVKLIDTHLGRNQYDMFLVKYDGDGNQLWLKQISGAGYEHPTDISVDNNGKILLTGYFDTSIAFENGTKTTVGPAFFVASYNADGSVNWSKLYGEGKNGTVKPCAVKVTSKNNIVIYGSFNGTKNFGGLNYTAEGEDDIFLMKLDAEGDATWERTFGGLTAEANGLAVDENENIYLAGEYKSLLKVRNITLTGDNVKNGFLVSYDKGGVVRWANNINDDENQTTESALDVSFYNNKIYISGYYGGKLPIGNTQLITMGGVLQGFVAAYNPDGSFVQAQNLACKSVIPLKLQIDSSGNVALYGTFSGPFTLGSKEYTPQGNNTVFLAGYKAE